MAQKQKGPLSAFLVVLFILFAGFALFPLFAVTLASFKPSTELLRYGLNLKLEWAIMSLKTMRLSFRGRRIIFNGTGIALSLLSCLRCYV